MSKFKKKKTAGTPGISTASLPDIVFMLLFFFMTATTMKDNDLKIENKLPLGDQTSKLHRKENVMSIFIGKPSERYIPVLGQSDRIQLNDKISSVSEVKGFVISERASRPSSSENKLTCALKIDENVRMGIVRDVKQELRKVEQLKVSYVTNQGSPVQD